MEKMRKKLFLLAAFLLLVFSMTGCGKARGYLEDQMVKKSGILEDADYLTYEGYLNEGKIDADGFYTEPVEDFFAGVVMEEKD